jgi:hypothetical protein
LIVAELSAQDAAVIIGACGALVVAILAPLLKVIADIRKQTSETNIAVNHRPKGDATLREIVEKIDLRIAQLEDDSLSRHDSNSRRIERVTLAVEAQTRKMDRLGDAIGGVNRRIDGLEERNEGDGK